MSDDERIVTTIGSLEACAPQTRLGGGARRRRIRVMGDETDCMLGIDGASFGDTGPDDRGIVVPMLEPPKGPALAIPDKKKPGAGNPRPAVPSKVAWRLGKGRYVLQRGDSFFGLAMTYLGAGPRWPEIRKIQSDDWKRRNPSPDLIREGDVLFMPAEAVQAARRLGLLPGVFGLSPVKVGLGAITVLVAGVGSYVVGTNS